MAKQLIFQTMISRVTRTIYFQQEGYIFLLIHKVSINMYYSLPEQFRISEKPFKLIMNPVETEIRFSVLLLLNR